MARKSEYERISLSVPPEIARQFRAQASLLGMRYRDFFIKLFQNYMERKEENER